MVPVGELLLNRKEVVPVGESLLNRKEVVPVEECSGDISW